MGTSIWNPPRDEGKEDRNFLFPFSFFVAEDICRLGSRLCRHSWDTRSFASRLAIEDVNLKTVQEQMGHQAIAMTARYAHLPPGYPASELDILVQRKSREERKSKRGKKHPVHGDPELVPGAFSGLVMLLACC